MATRTKDVPVLGKNNKVIPVNVPDFLFGAIEWILRIQDRLGMSKNPYVFGQYGTLKYRSSMTYFKKLLAALNLSHESKNLGSQGIRRARVTEVMVRITTSCFL
jgi:hypothetical protein